MLLKCNNSLYISCVHIICCNVHVHIVLLGYIFTHFKTLYKDVMIKIAVNYVPKIYSFHLYLLHADNITMIHVHIEFVVIFPHYEIVIQNSCFFVVSIPLRIMHVFQLSVLILLHYLISFIILEFHI
jgi:hypothetical protein